MWTELYLAYEGPSDTRDTKIAALRHKFNAFKALEGKKVNDSDSDVEEDKRTNNEFMADLNAEYHERALLVNPNYSSSFLAKCKASAGIKGLSEYKALESNIRHIQVKDIVKEVKDYLKTYSLAGMVISWSAVSISCPDKFACKLDSLIQFTCLKDPTMSGTLPLIPPPLGTGTSSPSSPNANRVDTMPNTNTTNTTTTNVA
ncbi:hypothetical protein Tco_0789015 [Tanacetum coccineum]